MDANAVPVGDYEFLDPRFRRLIIGHAKLERLWTGGRWAEGPVYVPAAKSVIWSDIPNDRLMRLDECSGAVSIFAHPCGFHNGHTLDAQGRIIACEHGNRRISRLEHDGTWTGLVDRFEGHRFNSPNDVVTHSDGSIWFTDPTYGIDSDYEGHRADSEIGHCHVYRFDPATNDLAPVVSDMLRPNGLAFSPDETTLYVADTGLSHSDDCSPDIRAYPVTGQSVGPGRHFATCAAGLFDGLRVDRHGNIWTSSADSVRAYAPDGTLLGRIRVPELVSNLCFGGPNRNRLYITAQTSLYAIYLNTRP
ncbi:MAG: SMP-30/gluconolactonase/LRE family protein [Janthinobacterium lividum]